MYVEFLSVRSERSANAVFRRMCSLASWPLI